MKAVILAGGLGTRLSEETGLRPKPMVEIGGQPILWHIMKTYEAHGIRDFIICCGYKGYVIKEYFQNYLLHTADVTFQLREGTSQIHAQRAEDWSVTLIDTGEHTMTGGRVARILKYVDDDDAFCLTYGDGLADIDISGLADFHRTHGKLATLTAVSPPGRFGALNFAGEADQVTEFVEKPSGEGGLINGGFFVLSPKIGAYIEDGDATVWEEAPLRNLARDGELMAYRHSGFWQPMDTLRDKTQLQRLWDNGNQSWKVW